MTDHGEPSGIPVELRDHGRLSHWLDVLHDDSTAELDEYVKPFVLKTCTMVKTSPKIPCRTVEAGSAPTGGEHRRITEWLLRWPSAPLYRISRHQKAQLDLGRKASTFHSFRVLTSEGWREQASRASTIYLLHHGLNEVDDLSFYYDLAADLIATNPGAVCVLRPFPSHLNRHPFAGPFSEKPLDRQLGDSGDLLRQFLRYMVETRWLLSALAPIDSYDVPSGGDLLPNRLSADGLATEIANEWRTLLAVSRETTSPTGDKPPQAEPDPVPATRDGTGETGAKQDELRAVDAGGSEHQGMGESPLGDVPSSSEVLFDEPGSMQAMVVQSVETLRTLVLDRRDLQPVGAQDLENAPPKLHVIGYSLGGFVAQSVLHGWPYLIGGCSTFLSGGALRELTLARFAEPEEWETILHSLRYEMVDAFLSRRLERAPAVDPTREPTIAGLPERQFDFFLRLFHEIFQEEYRKAYQTRTAEFARRVLFITGGADEIVHTQSVIDAAPPQTGINLIQVAHLTHFFQNAKGESERDQRRLWLPEIARLINVFSQDADAVRCAGLKKVWLTPDLHRLDKVDDHALHDRRLPETGDQDQTLEARAFESMLDVMTFRSRRPRKEPATDEQQHSADEPTPGPGILVVAENMIPTILLPLQAMRDRAVCLHHGDEEIAGYLRGVYRRAEALRVPPDGRPGHGGRNSGGAAQELSNVAFVLPAEAGAWHEDRQRTLMHPSRSETIPSLIAPRPDRHAEWTSVCEHWGTAIRRFCPGWQVGERQAEGEIGETQVPWIQTAARFVTNGGIDLASEHPPLADWNSHHPFDIWPNTLVSTLPNVWIWIDEEVGQPQDRWSGRQGVVDAFFRFLARVDGHAMEESGRTAENETDPAVVERFKQKRRRYLRDLVATQHLVCVRMSGAHFNPRLRGKLILRPDGLERQLAHTALALALSEPFFESEEAWRATVGTKATLP